MTLSFDTADARTAITPSWSRPPDTVYCFFRAPYEKRDPVPFR